MSENQNAASTDDKKPAAKRHITIVDNYRMRLEAPNPKGGDRPASLAWTFVGDNPRCNLNTNVESDPRGGYLPIRVNIRTLRRLMNLIVATAAGETPTGNTIKNHLNYDADGNYNETPVHVSTFIVGKEEDGRLYLAAHAPGYTPIKFHFEQDPYHSICNRKGEPLPISDVSPMVAKDYADLINEFLPMSLHEVAMAKGVATDAPVKSETDDASVEESSRDNNNNYNRGGGNNYNRNGGGGGGRNNYNRGGYNKGGGNNYNRGGGNNNYNRGGNNNYNNNRNYNNGGGNNNYRKDNNSDFDTSAPVADGDSLEF